jgi:outer membrane immunogenic protein
LNFLVNGATTAMSFSQTRGGWVVGGGVETALGANWSAKLEYLYVDLGNWTHTTVPINFGLPEFVQEHLRDNIIRVGLNYHFGDGAVLAKQ